MDNCLTVIYVQLQQHQVMCSATHCKVSTFGLIDTDRHLHWSIDENFANFARCREAITSAPMHS